MTKIQKMNKIKKKILAVKNNYKVNIQTILVVLKNLNLKDICKMTLLKNMRIKFVIIQQNLQKANKF